MGSARRTCANVAMPPEKDRMAASTMTLKTRPSSAPGTFKPPYGDVYGYIIALSWPRHRSNTDDFGCGKVCHHRRRVCLSDSKPEFLG